MVASEMIPGPPQRCAAVWLARQGAPGFGGACVAQPRSPPLHLEKDWVAKNPSATRQQSAYVASIQVVAQCLGVVTQP